MNNWRKTLGQRVRHLTPEQAREIIDAVSQRGPTIFHPEIRKLTGGFNSQAINYMVLRKLAVKAGIIKV